jgi:hypothetical protein
MQNSTYSNRWGSLADRLAQIERESGGLLRLEIIGARDHFAIASTAFNGDRTALSRMRAIIQSAKLPKNMRPDQPATCLCCPDTVTDPLAALALLAPATDTASVAVCIALCPGCSTGTVDEVLHPLAAAYRAQWRGLRCIEVTHSEGGRA